MKRFSISVFTVLLFHLNMSAQESPEFGFLPSLNLNKKLSNDWSLNFKTESRQSIAKDGFEYDYLLTDFMFAASKKTGINTAVAIGYLMRIKEDGIENRTIQQATFIKRHASFRLSHRLLADQTFSNEEPTELRFRYRISAEIPLQGRSLDPKEFFMKVSNEYLNSLYEKRYDMEIRETAFIGYAFSPDDKLELGLDYRASSIFDNNPRNRLWIGLNYYKSF